MRDKTIDIEENKLRGDLFRALKQIAGNKITKFDLSKLYIQDGKLKVTSQYMLAEVELPMDVEDSCTKFPSTMPYKRTGELEYHDGQLIYKQDDRAVTFDLEDIDEDKTPPFDNVIREDSDKKIKFKVDLFRKVLDLVEATGQQFFEIHFYDRKAPVKIKTDRFSVDNDTLKYNIMLAPAL